MIKQHTPLVQCCWTDFVRFTAATCLVFLCSVSLQAQKYVELIIAKDVIEKGFEQYNNEEYAACAKTFAKVPRFDTSYFYAQYEMTLCLYQNKEYAKAIENSQRLIAEGTDIALQYSLLGNAYDYLKRTDEAIAAYNVGLSKFPYNTNLLLNKGVAYETAERYKEALDHYQKAAEINPIYPSFHLRMGLIAEKEGRITEAIMAYTTFLVLEPVSARSNTVLDILNKLCNKSSESFNTIEKKTYETSFEDIDFLVQNQVALNSKYKVPGKFTYPVNKQIHLIAENVAKSGYPESSRWYIKIYGNLFSNLLKSVKYEHFTLLLLSNSKNEKIQSELKKNIDKVRATRDICVELIQQPTNESNFSYSGKNYKLGYIYYDGFELRIRGNRNAKSELIGDFFLFSKNGTLARIGKFDQSAMKTGEWITFGENGDTMNVYTYKNDKQNGPYRIYKNGYLVERGVNVNDQLDGTAEVIFPNGVVSKRFIYSNGKREGKANEYWANGKIFEESTYKGGNYEGSLKLYFKNGVLRREINFTGGLADGILKDYFENGSIKSEKTYKKDVLEGPYKTYYQNGQIESDGKAAKGSISGQWKEYYSHGALYREAIMDENGKFNGISTYFSSTGKPFLEETFAKGDLKSMKYFDVNGKVIGDYKFSGKTPLIITNYNKSYFKISEGTVQNGERTGKWKFFFPNGITSEETDYKDGKIDGKRIVYFMNGKKAMEESYKEGKLEGLFLRFYENGTLSTEGNFANDEKQGVWIEYELNGSMSDYGFFREGKKHGWHDEFNTNGKLYRRYLYDEGKIKQFNVCDTAGNTVDSVLIGNGNVDMSLKNADGKVIIKGSYVNYQLHGPYQQFYPNGQLVVNGAFDLGSRVGKWTYYHPNGKKSSEGEYFMGKRHGTWSYYNYWGELTKSYDYMYGESHGPSKWYNASGKVQSNSEYYEDARHNESRYFNPDGTLREVRYYRYGDYIGYSYPGKDGKLVDTIFAKNNSGIVKCYHPNGNVSAEYEIVNGRYHGSFKWFYPNGQVLEERFFEYGQEIKPDIEYFPDGKVRIKTEYSFGKMQGTNSEYYSNGKVRSIEQYVNDMREGWQEYYDQNGKVKRYFYFNGEVIYE